MFELSRYGCALGCGLFLGLGCRESRPDAPQTKEVASSQSAGAVETEAFELPAEFPSQNDRTVTGELAGKAFEAAKAVLRDSGTDVTLSLYSWAVPGDACRPQYAPEPHQLYVTVSLPEALLDAGKPIQADQDGVTVTYKRPELGGPEPEAVVVFDQLGGEVRGRLWMKGDDGSRVAGGFEATRCRSPQRTVSPSEGNADLSWGLTFEPAALPERPLTARLLGELERPAQVEAIDWQSDGFAQHELHFYVAPPERKCQPSQTEPGFKIGFGRPLRPGVEVHDSGDSGRGRPFAAALWREPGGVLGQETRGGFAARIDEVTNDEVRGRVHAWFRDPSKSVVLGAFTARRCSVGVGSP